MTKDLIKYILIRTTNDELFKFENVFLNNGCDGTIIMVTSMINTLKLFLPLNCLVYMQEFDTEQELNERYDEILHALNGDSEDE